MPVSQKLGALPWLSFPWDHGPIAAFIIVLLFDFGMICILMSFEGLPVWKRRPLYKTFFWGDMIFIPMLASGVVLCMEAAPAPASFYVQPWWHWLLITLGIVLSLLMEVGAMKGGQYTWNQERSPSKLYHTLIFGVMFYWIISGLVAALAVQTSVSGLTLVGLGILGWVAMNVLDWRGGVAGLKLESFTLEGTYIPWKWGPREK